MDGMGAIVSSMASVVGARSCGFWGLLELNEEDIAGGDTISEPCTVIGISGPGAAGDALSRTSGTVALLWAPDAERTGDGMILRPGRLAPIDVVAVYRPRWVRRERPERSIVAAAGRIS